MPAIIEWPQRIKQPRVTNVPANTTDIYPTLLELVGIAPTKQPVLDGISLVSVIDGKSDGPSQWAFGSRTKAGLAHRAISGCEEWRLKRPAKSITTDHV